MTNELSTDQWLVVGAVVLTAVALWLLLPRAGARSRLAGVVVGLAALGLFASQLDMIGSWASQSVFLILAATTVISAVAAVTLRSPVYCAIWFALTLMGTAGLMLLAGAQFLGVATIVVYAGAILVTFLFVLMLAQPEGHAFYDRVSWEGLLSSCAGALLVGMLTMTAASVYRQPAAEGEETAAAIASSATPEARAEEILYPEQMERIGARLFSEHLIAIEVAGVLLLVALVGATAIIGQHKQSQPERLGGERV